MTSNRSPWQREPVVMRVADALIDRREAGPSLRVQPVRIRLDPSTVPDLFTAGAAEADYQWALIERMAAEGWIRLRLDRGRPGQPGYYLNPRAELVDETALRALIQRVGASPEEQWRIDFLGELTRLLGSNHPALSLAARRRAWGLEAKAPVEVARRLSRLQELDPESLLLREASSQLFWGHSKVFDGQQELIAALMGTPECPFQQSPIQLNLQLPTAPFERVLFVENWATFARMSRQEAGQHIDLALVYASGYRGSARRLRSRNGATLYFAGMPLPSPGEAARFTAWLRDEVSCAAPVYFFGDLDFEGMGILARLRETFPGARAWEPGYRDLLGLLTDGHSAKLASKTGQRDPGATGCEFADRTLLPAMRESGKFIDQEMRT